MRCVRLVVLAFIVMLCSAASSSAATGTLKITSKPVLWSGAVTAGAGPTAEVPECASGCQRFDVEVDLPAGVWVNKPGGVQFAIRWVSRTLGDNLKLYVYRDGALAAKSDGIISTAQSVTVPEAANGTFQVYAVYDPGDGATPLSTTVAYDGLAEVEYEPKMHPLRPLIPDLVVRPQRNVSFDPGGVFFDEISPTYPSCYTSEVLEEGAQTCLRFDQVFANIGAGPLELRFTVPVVPEGEPKPESVGAAQRIYWSDGHAADRFAGLVEYHVVHDHYHFESFGVSRLWTVAHGKKKDLVRQRKHDPRGSAVRMGRKVSFCLADIEVDSWAQKGDGARTYNAPECLFPAATSDGNDYFVQGITNGWADVYDWYLPDQYMEVTGIADGVYILDTLADPDDALLEADDSNNCGGVFIRLWNMGGSSPRAEILGSLGGCTP
jgi:hypothetical protein